MNSMTNVIDMPAIIVTPVTTPMWASETMPPFLVELLWLELLWC